VSEFNNIPNQNISKDELAKLLQLLDAEPSTPLQDEWLLKYQEGTLKPEEEHIIEQWLSNQTPESEAIEGLKTLNKGQARHLQHNLHASINKTIKNKRKKRSQQPQYITTYAIILVLLLACIGYIILKIYAHK